MKNRATFTLYVSLPDDWTVNHLEQATSALMELLAQADVNTLNATWSCPTLGRKETSTAPVLVFERKNE